METFDLFRYLGQSENQDAFIYRCGYYIVNRYCNNQSLQKIKDSFYTIFDNMFLKFDVSLFDDIQHFSVYRLRDLTDEQIQKVSCFTIDLEDVDTVLIPVIMNIESISVI